MKTIAVNKKFLRDFQDRPLDPHLVEPALCRYMSLVEVEDADRVAEELPDQVDLSIYLLLYRVSPMGREVAVLSPPAIDGRRNFHGDWFALDEKDWNNFTIQSNFDVGYMLNTAVRNILADPILLGTDLHMTRSYGIVDVMDGGANNELATICAAVAVRIPDHIELDLIWQVVTPDFPAMDLMTLPRQGDNDAPSAATH